MRGAYSALLNRRKQSTKSKRKQRTNRGDREVTEHTKIKK